jgi:hypothetical protein
MKNLLKNLKGKSLLCSLCLALVAAFYPYYGSFIFLGEPEVPACLKEE